MFVKICGITNLDDALTAVRYGADAVGFVFWRDSPRWIDPHKAQVISAMLPPFVTPVGVFVNQPIEYVNEVADVGRLGAVQLHGDEDVDFAARVHRPVLKAMSVAAAEDPSVDRTWPCSSTMLLLDAHDPVRRGGTGRTIDWTGASAVAARRRVLLAGGLTPGNVAAAIDQVAPFGIDVSSGVERAPGIKDSDKLQALFEAIHDSSDNAARPRQARILRRIWGTIRP